MMRMKTAAFALAAAISSSVAAPHAGAQTDAKRRYVIIDYQKPAPGKNAEYVNVERNLWKPVHQDRVNRGTITSWKLYRVAYPNGAGQEYDFVTMTEFPSYAAMESPYTGSDAKAILGDAKYDQMRTQTGTVRTLVRSDVFGILASTEGWSKADSRIIEVVYLKPAPQKGGELMRIQREHFNPMNEDQVKAGFESGWATMGLRYPQMHDRPYDFISFNTFKSWSQMDQRTSPELAQKWRSKSNEVYSMIDSVRKRVRGELWVRIDQTDLK